MDLPCHEGDALDRTRGEGEVGDRLLAKLIDEASVKLSPRTLTAAREAARQQGEQCELRDRLLVLGGPGQGKSTVSQFLAQLLRSHWLVKQPSGTVQADALAAAKSTIERAEAEGITRTGIDRFPIRVDLPEFADSLAKGQSNSLLSYVAADISKVSDREIDVGTLRIWLATYPWLLILDGLDEVPRSANRALVIRKITEFSDEIFNSQADVFQVVFTRPQGYNDDLSKDDYAKLSLSFLGAEDAVRYANALALTQIIQETQRVRVINRLLDALKTPATSRLLISPLQVAIMLALLDKKGEVPTDRWSLFDGYYHVIVDRERAKPGPVSEIIR
ncbi:MAG: hypothetical protein EOO38_32305, partial [Cytophagaceae bacterium]